MWPFSTLRRIEYKIDRLTDEVEALQINYAELVKLYNATLQLKDSTNRLQKEIDHAKSDN